MLGEYQSDDVNDPVESDSAIVEGVDADLVRGVVHRRCRSSQPPRHAGEFNSGKCQVVERLKGPARCRTPIARPRDARQPIRPAQTERNRKLHVWWRTLRKRRAVDELHHGVHDRLRMHHHINSIQVHAVQQVRLEQFQTLVHQRRGVGRDHSAHVPGRVCQSLIRSDIAHLFAAEPAEGSAACGENEPIDLRRGATAKALRQRGVFGVDGNNLIWTCGFGDQRAADHKRLLVGQGKDSPSPQCGQRCSKPGGAGDPIEDDVTRHRRQLRGRIWARQDAR